MLKSTSGRAVPFTANSEGVRRGFQRANGAYSSFLRSETAWYSEPQYYEYIWVGLQNVLYT